MKTFLSFILTHHYEGMLSTTVAVIYIILSLATTIHILLRKSDIKSAIGWIALVFLSPFLGTILYIFLGINRVRRKAVKLGKAGGAGNYFSDEEKNALIDSMPAYIKNMITFGQNLYSQEFLKGNILKPLQNGTQAYPEMLNAIRNAKKEVLVESYIFDRDETTKEFLEAFKIAIENGASVKVLVDGFGTMRFFRRGIEKELAKIKGLQFGVFLPPQIPISLPFVNLRNHRKLIVVDGIIAFFGGMNLSKNNILLDDKKHGVSDITFKIEGPIIDQISQIFEEDWFFVKKKTFDACSNFVKYENISGIPARVIPDGPDIISSRTEFLIRGILNLALKHVVITTPYFLPENNILSCIEMAAMRGINVEIIIPEISDHKIIGYAQEANFASLIEKGVKIYKKSPPFDHSKIFIVDDIWTFIGSANWDVRSFRLNFEANMELFSKDFAEDLLKIVESKKADSRLVTLEECNNITFFKKLRNSAARLLTPYY